MKYFTKEQLELLHRQYARYQTLHKLNAMKGSKGAIEKITQNQVKLVTDGFVELAKIGVSGDDYKEYAESTWEEHLEEDVHSECFSHCYISSSVSINSIFSHEVHKQIS
jgi:hypothetical protein